MGSDAAPGAPSRILDSARLRALCETGLLDSEVEADFDRLTLMAARLLKAPAAAVSLVDTERQFLKSAVGIAEPWASRREMPRSHSLCRIAVEKQAVLLVSDARVEAPADGQLAQAELGTVAYAGVPLVADRQVIGTFCVMDREPRRWAEDEVALLSELGKSVERLIELRRQRAALARVVAEQDRQMTLLRALAHALPNAAVAGFDAELRYLFADGQMLEEITGLRSEEVVGRHLSEVLQPTEPGETRGLELYRAALEGHAGQREVRRHGRVYEHRIIPVREAGRVIAGLALLYDVTERRQEAEALRRLNETVAAQAEALRVASLTDELTGLRNRRGFRLLAEQALARATRDRKPLLVIYVDLNGMKLINDRLGHEVGDRALVETAGLLRATFRDVDVLSRLGGDEYAVIAVDSGPEAIEAITGRLDQAVAAFNAARTAPFELSLSTGVVARQGGGAETLDDLLGRADALMYERKRARKLTRG